MQTWALKYHNTRNRAMLYFHAEHRDLNTLSVMISTNLNTTINLPGAARWNSKLTYQDSRWNRAHLALICSNISTARGIIKPTQTHVHSGSITSTESGTLENIKSSIRIGANQFIQSWIVNKHDSKEPQSIFTKFLKKNLSLTLCWRLINISTLSSSKNLHSQPFVLFQAY